MPKQASKKAAGFVKNQSYDFTPPLTTNCIPIHGQSGWSKKTFSHGWCLGLKDDEKNIYIFQGKPNKEEVEHFFHVQWGKGSVGETTKPKHTRSHLSVVR